ncbi:MAG: hypothetical protein JO246_08645 [Frankiaceae bacterium]|nr:hypothetical protein [Frankiaceae bacterium]MBV9869084.1 hypothetical protein [Frankiaceae bacterium]
MGLRSFAQSLKRKREQAESFDLLRHAQEQQEQWRTCGMVSQFNQPSADHGDRKGLDVDDVE